VEIFDSTGYMAQMEKSKDINLTIVEIFWLKFQGKIHKKRPIRDDLHAL
jgi:hypothetical protein